MRNGKLTKSNDGSGGDSVESAGASQENKTKDDNPGSGPKKGVEGHIESWVDDSPNAAEGQTTVSGKSIGHSGAGGHDGGGSEDHADDGEDDEADTAGLAVGGIEVDLEKSAGGRLDDGLDILEDEEEAGEEDETGGHADEDAPDHDARAFLSCVGDLLCEGSAKEYLGNEILSLVRTNHVGGGIKSSKSKSTLKKSKEPRQTIGPANLIDELAVDKATALVVGRGTSEDSDADDDETRDTPQESSLVEQWEEAVGKSVDEEGDKGESEVDEELMPGLGLVGRVHERDGVDNESASEKRRGGSQDDIASSVDPTSHIADTSRPSRPTNESTPMILSTGSRIGRQKFGQRSGETKIADTSDHQSPDDSARSTGGEGETDGGGQGGPGVENGKGKTQQRNL